MLEIKGLSKSFNKLILDDINLTLEKGNILGILGPNGCGKTTLLKILSNLSPYNKGEILLDNEKMSYLTNKHISFLPDVPFLPTNISVKKAIEYYEFFYDDFDKEKALRLLKELNVDTNMTIAKLSKGTSEKLHLILVLSRNAKLYILDEPIAGVDILTRKQILKILIENINENSLVIVTTHLINDIEAIFDKVCFLNNKKLSKMYDVEEFRATNEKSIEDLYIEYFGGYTND